MMASRKEEHKQAGKRMLEEFRKKKAADKAKKAAPRSQPNVVDVSTNDTQPLETERVRHTDSDVAVSSNGAIMETSDLVINYDNNSGQGSSNNSHVSPPSTNENNAFPAEVQNSLSYAKDQEFKTYGALGFAGPSNFNDDKQTKDMNDDFGITSRAKGRFQYGITPDQSIPLHSPVVRDIGSNFNQSSYSGQEEAQLKNSSPLKDSTVNYPGTTHVVSTNVSPENPGRTLLPNKSDYANMLPNGHIPSLYEGVRHATKVTDSALEVGHNMQDSMQFKDHVISDTGESKLSSFVGQLHNGRSGPSLMSESISTSFSFDVRSSSNHEPVYPSTAETNTWRSRPSFLDSLNVSRVSSAAPVSFTEPKKDGLFMSNSFKVYSTGVLGTPASQKPLTETKMGEPFLELSSPSMPSAFEHSINSSFSSIGADLLGQSVDENSFGSNHRYHSPKHDEDFSALEQHIEDLTQEKFSLQRAVEASRALAESLAAENSSLTESYNQQGRIVNQLQSDMEMLQEEIKTQLAELESVKMEYGNVLLECNAADERGKLLASEVIGLEEKVLRLRSNELKLERQLENSYAEMASYKKKMSSLEKDRQDLLSTINALQEEKKLLQTKVRNASVSGKYNDVSKSPTKKKDTSTSTEDLDPMPDTSNLEMRDSASVLHNDASSSTLLPENREFNIEISSVNVPADQMRMIQNIDILISELALEKEELIKALAAESSHSARLKDLNKELSRKLETQTQRLELLTAQSMANGNPSTRQPDTRTSHGSSAYVDEGVPTYADEGDEVVERVLGWIMKLFPGGPSKRRTSKLL